MQEVDHTFGDPQCSNGLLQDLLAFHAMTPELDFFSQEERWNLQEKIPTRDSKELEERRGE
jgi:hypothetical protein